MKQLLDNRNVTFYTRYVDDILVIRYWKNKLWSHHLIHKLNTQRHSTQPHTWNYKLCKLSWFTIVIIRKTANLEIAIYRKPTTTDKTINFFFSNQPMEHKISTYRHHITRINSLPLTAYRKQKEWVTIQQIAQNSNFPQTLVQQLNHRVQHKHTDKSMQTVNNKKRKPGRHSHITAH